jgi:hypothetical protein
MKYVNDSIEELNIAYIGGGSRNWAWCLMMHANYLTGCWKIPKSICQAGECNQMVDEEGIYGNTIL